MLNILLNTGQNSLHIVVTFLGFIIAMIWLFSRKSKDDSDKKI